ncbi:MAG: 2-oxoacid:acceptor oxidoreductase subunit alpha [Candidatus Riflebacteria bacterium]|nr:2-oxoacid:acceptor oxidoreductase subunit alpha [Candidatus Riflebacteria bacterium]
MLFYKLYKDKDGRKVGFVQGNEACAEAALAAGVRFFAGYPITPSSEIAQVLAEKLPMYGGRFIQMEDEIAAMAAIIGASMTGVKTLTATSGPGFSLKQENIGYACMNEVPCLIVNVQRAGPSTGLPTQVSQGDVMQTRWGTHGDHPIVVYSPCSVEETAELTITAINTSEKYRTPVILLMDETVAHMREKITLPHESEMKLFNRTRATVEPSDFRSFDTRFGDVPPFEPYGNEKGYRFHITGLNHDENGFPTSRQDEVVPYMDRIHRKIYNNLDDIIKVKEWNTDDADFLLIAFGTTVRTCLGAMEKGRKKGLKIGVLQLITVWPFADKVVARLAKKIENIFVVELNMGQIINEVSRAAAGHGKIKGINKYDGVFITPDEILTHLK